MIRGDADHAQTHMRLTILAALAGAVLLTGCGSDDSVSDGASTTAKAAPAAAEQTTTIRIADFKYDPSPASVKAGEKITITNEDEAPHTVTDDGTTKAFDSGDIKGKTTDSITFAKAGTYSYICEFHPFMKGSITVTK